MQEFSDEQRRVRLASRHGLAHRFGSVPETVERMTCLHATEPASVYLSAFARADVSRADVDRALYDDRSVVKQLAMRRTLFAFPRALLPAVWGSASDRVATQLRTRLAKEVVSNGLHRDGEAWLARMKNEVLAALADGPATTAELRERIPPLALRLELSPGKTYGGSFPIAPRFLGTVAATGRILRGSNAGDWRVSRPRWTLAEDWLGERPPPEDSSAGYVSLVERWLRTFGPGTEADLVWWFGATKAAVRQALRELGAVEVAVSGGTGYLLPDDLDDVPAPEPWAALLPVLDPHHHGLEAARLLPRPRRRARTCSTPTATPAPPRGGTVRSSAAGSRTTTASSRSWSAATSAPRASGRWTPRQPGSPPGSTARRSAPSTRRR